MGDKNHRLINFLDIICPKALRKTFLKYMSNDFKRSNHTLGNYLAARKSELYSIKKKKVMKQDQWALLFPKSGQADESSWDITLVVLLIDTFFSKKLLQSERDAIDEIRRIRNKLKHTADKRITNGEFDDLWTRLETATVNLAKQISQNPPYVNEIRELIDDARVNNMPELGNALRSFYHSHMIEMEATCSNMRESIAVNKRTSEDTLAYSKENNAILVDSSVQKDGRSGKKVKRLKTQNNKMTYLNECFKTTMDKDMPINVDNRFEIEDIKSKLPKNHHIVVTGHPGSRYRETALAAIKDLPYNHERCVEINKVSEWKQIDLDDVDLVLCIQPFLDNKKSEEVYKLLSTMYRAAKRSDGENIVDVVFVLDKDSLKKYKHEILTNVVCVCSPTSKEAPIDLTYNLNEDNEGRVSSCLKNLIESSEIFAQSYVDKSTVSKVVLEEAKAKLKQFKVIVITGPKYCGKTTLALKEAFKYQKGEYLIINKADDMKYVSLNTVCLVVVDDFAGKRRYDTNGASDWMLIFDRWHAVVKAGRLNMILTSEDKIFEKCKKQLGHHPIFDNVVQMNESDIIIKQENDENVSPSKSMTSDGSTGIQQTPQKRRKLGNISRPLGAQKIKTFVFMHINTSDCRITELCLFAVSRNALSESHLQSVTQPSLFRLRNKLSMRFNPNHFIDEELDTLKMRDILLSGQERFTLHSAFTIDAFLKRLQQPFCLVAHNGNNFYFKVLQAELKGCGLYGSDDSTDSDSDDNDERMSAAELMFDRMLCVDSLNYFKGHAFWYFGSTALRSLFEKRYGRPAPNVHTAEGCCIALLSVLQGSLNFLSWVDRNAIPMANI